MGLSSRRGTTDPREKGCFNTPDSEIPAVENTSIEANPDQVLDSQAYVANTLDGQNTVESGSKANELTAALLAYISGSKITVTWFHSLTTEDYKHTAQTDWSPTLNNVHYSFQKINNFVFAINGSFNFEYTQDIAKSSLTGEGVLYPYFCPNQADMFVYEVEPGIYGLYKLLEAPIRMTIRTTTCHTIRFGLLRYLSKDEYNKLLECVEQEVYFSLDNYLATNGGFLTSDERTAEFNCEEAIQYLINYYNSEFYEAKVFKTYIDSHCLYDPYVVEFIKTIVPIKDMPGYPTQLVPNPKNWRRSFWFRLLYPEILPNENVIYTAWRVLKRITYRSVGINALSNHCFISISKDGRHPYPPFKLPEAFDETVQTFQMEVKLYLEQGKIRPPVLFAQVHKIASAARPAQFYFIPIMIFLLKRLKKALDTGENIVLGDLSNSDTCTNDCENCILDCATCGHKPHCPPKHHHHHCIDQIVNNTHCACKCTAACMKYLISDDAKMLLEPEYYRAVLHDIHDGCEEYTNDDPFNIP